MSLPSEWEQLLCDAGPGGGLGGASWAPSTQSILSKGRVGVALPSTWEGLCPPPQVAVLLPWPRPPLIPSALGPVEPSLAALLSSRRRSEAALAFVTTSLMHSSPPPPQHAHPPLPALPGKCGAIKSPVVICKSP